MMVNSSCNIQALSNETRIVFLADPASYVYWREREVECGTRGRRPPLQRRKHLGLMVAYSVLSVTAPSETGRSFMRRVWTIRPYDLGYPGVDRQECEYPEGSGRCPSEAVDPRSIQAGNPSLAPIPRVFVVLDAQSQRWMVKECPYCGQSHWHGGGDKNENPLDFLGHRSAHCNQINSRGYYLVAAEGSNDE